MPNVFETLIEARLAAKDWFAVDSQSVSVEMLVNDGICIDHSGRKFTRSWFIHRDGRFQRTQFED